MIFKIRFVINNLHAKSFQKMYLFLNFEISPKSRFLKNPKCRHFIKSISKRYILEFCNSNIDDIVGFYEPKKYFLSFSAPRLSQTKLRNFFERMIIKIQFVILVLQIKSFPKMYFKSKSNNFENSIAFMGFFIDEIFPNS